jgi:hypothetical protein
MLLLYPMEIRRIGGMRTRACMQIGKTTDISLRRRDFKEKSTRILSVFGAFLTTKEPVSVEID